MGAEIWEIDLDDIEVEPGKRITIHVEFEGDFHEFVLDERVAMAVVRQFIKGQYALIHWSDEPGE